MMKGPPVLQVNLTFPRSLYPMNELRYTLAHELGHLLQVSTRNSPPEGIDNGLEHDPGAYPNYKYTLDTGDLVIGARAVNRGLIDEAVVDTVYYARDSLMRAVPGAHAPGSVMRIGNQQIAAPKDTSDESVSLLFSRWFTWG